MSAARERNAVRAAAITAGLMIAAQVAAKATRDALFLGRYEARHLPVAMLIGGAGSLLAIIAFSRLLRRRGPQTVVPAAFTVSAGVFALEWFLSPAYPEVTIWLLYLHIATLGGVVISGFWSMYSECFDPATAKRVIGKVVTAASLGGLLGGAAAERLAALADVPATLLLLALMNLATAAGALRLGRNTVARAAPKASGDSTLSILRNNPYLKHLALLVTLVGLGGALIDFAFKAQADAELVDQGRLLRFFAAFYAITSLLTLVAQALWTKRLLAKLGIAITIALLPASVLIFSVLGAAVTRLWALVLLRGAESVVGHAMYRSGYELLYTPIPREKKRSTKTIIDVAFDRLGDILGGLTVLLFVFALPAWAPRVAVVAAAVVGSATLVVAWRLHGGYVGALAESLRLGTVDLDEPELADATTRKTFADTTMALDRDRLLAEIEKFTQDREQPPDHSPVEPPVARRAQPVPGRRFRESVEVLTSDDNEAIKELLRDEAKLGPQLGPFIVPLLARRETREVALDALGALAPHIVGQLHDALLDSSQPRAVRRSVPSVLRGYPHRRSADALLDGLSTERLELRYRCGQGLVAIAAARPDAVRVDKTTIYERVLAELAGGSTAPEDDHPADTHTDGPAGWLDDAVRRRLDRKLEHAFSLLSLIYDANALQLCLRALYAKDTTLRGTALEYLDSVLPPEVKTAVWAHLDIEHPRNPTQRGHKEALKELLLSADGLVLDPALLKRPRTHVSDK